MSGDALATDALVRLASGEIAVGLQTWHRAVAAGVSAGLGSRMAPLVAHIEGRLLRPRPAARLARAIPPSEAWARAWAGDLCGARALAEGQPPDASSLGVLGAVAVLERRPDAALPLLDRAIGLGGGHDLVLMRARALIQLGRLEEALHALGQLIDGETFARRVVLALANVRMGRYWPTFAAWRRQVTTDETHMNGFFTNELPAAVGREDLDRAFQSPAALAALLESLLERMAGNLGPCPTLAEPGESVPRFAPLELPVSTRSEAVDALNSIRYEGPASAEAALLVLRERRPRSVHPRCYMGELYLWLGRYEQAWREFVAARWKAPARWADIGMLAVLVLTGRLRRARLAALYAEHHHSFIPGGTLPVYRGALHRRMGNLDPAIADLGAAVSAKPTRIGARMELTLALRAAGRHGEATEHASILLRDAAPLLVDVTVATGQRAATDLDVLISDEVLEAALVAMRGNRSSSIVTWFGRDGDLRVLASPSVIQQDARQALSALRSGPMSGAPRTP